MLSNIWLLVYFAGAAFVLLKGLIVIFRIILLRQRSTKLKIGHVDVLAGPDLPAFSFFNWIFLNDKQLSGNQSNYIIAHEKAHAKQKHSADLILIELIHAILWFNPFLILYKKQLKECHEYLADEAVLYQGADLKNYARSLQNELLNNRYHRLASYFKGSTLRKRLEMAVKIPSKLATLLYLSIIPLLVGSMYAFSYIEDPVQFNDLLPDENKKFTILIDPGHGGKDPGAINEELGIKEKDIVLNLAKAIKKQAPKDINVILTHKKDQFLSLDDRVSMTKEYNADIIVSLHVGSLNDDKSRDQVITYYSPLNDYANQSFDVANWFNQSVGFWIGGVLMQPQQGPFVILSKSAAPGILVEIGNLQNEQTARNYLNSNYIKAIGAGIISCLNHVKTKIETTYPEGKIIRMDEKRQHNSFAFPLPREKFSRVIQYYSTSRMHPILKVKRPHTGIDLEAPMGTEVLATDHGIVADVKRSRARSGYGTYVKIEHNNGIESFYAHLDNAIVEKGQKVKARQVIGHLGRTGLTVSPHLHFEIRKEKRAVNPNEFIRGYLNMGGNSKKIGITSNPPRFTCNPGDIGPALMKMGLSFSETAQWGEPHINHGTGEYSLLIKNKLTNETYSYELEVRGDALFLSKDKPARRFKVQQDEVDTKRTFGQTKISPSSRSNTSKIVLGQPNTFGIDSSKYPSLFPQHRKFIIDSINPSRSTAILTTKVK